MLRTHQENESCAGEIKLFLTLFLVLIQLWPVLQLCEASNFKQLPLESYKLRS